MKYGPLKEIWLASYAPFYAFVVFRNRLDAQVERGCDSLTVMTGGKVGCNCLTVRTPAQGRTGPGSPGGG